MYSTTIAVGRLTKDPIIKPYSSGQGELALFSLAVNRTKDKTDFYECVAFGKTAEMVKNYLSNGKGRMILVEGSFQNNNNKREVQGIEVTNFGMNLAVNRIQFLDAPPKAQESAAPQQQYQQAPQQGFQQGYQQQPAATQQQQEPQYGAPTGGYQQQQAPQAPFQPVSTPDPFAQQPGFSGMDISDDDLPF